MVARQTDIENRNNYKKMLNQNSLDCKAIKILEINDMLKLPVDLISIAKNNNIETYYINISTDKIIGAIKYNAEENIYQIIIDKSINNLEKRYVLAYQLATFFLKESELNKGEILYQQKYGMYDSDIDYLARAILMNDKFVRELYELNPSISELSNLFKVTESEMTLRLMELEIL